MKLKAVIFDLDGTLLNTVADIASAMNSVLANNNLPTHDEQGYKYFVGKGLKSLVYNALPSHLRTAELLPQYFEQLLAEYAKFMDEQTRPYPGIIDMLQQLQQKNIAMAILSNKAHQFMNDVVTTHFDNYNFSAVFGAREGVPSKPHPHSALEIATIMKLPQQQIAFLGDSEVDMQTATSANMYAIGAAWGFRTREELISSGAQTIISDPLELVSLLG